MTLWVFAFHISQDKNVDPCSKMFIPLKILHKSFILLWDRIKIFAFVEKSKLTIFQALLEYWVQKIVFQCSFFLEELRVGAAAASGSQRGKITTKETCDLVFLWHFYTLCHDDSLRSKIASLQVFCNKGYHVIVTAEWGTFL